MSFNIAKIIESGTMKEKIEKINDGYLDIKTCKTVRAVMAVLIILHHISQYAYFGPIFNMIFEQIGSTATVIFFFYSGYGVMTGLVNKENYMGSFLKKRMLSVGIPFLIANVIHFLCLKAVGLSGELLSALKELRIEEVLIPNSWFVIMLMMMYIAFYVSFGVIKSRKYGIEICAAMIMTVGLLLCGSGFREYWYSSLLAFVFGMFYADHGDRLRKLLSGKKLPVFFSCGAIFVLLTVMAKMVSYNYLVMIIRNLRSIAACLIILLLSSLIRQRNRVLEHVGDISYEIFLYHGIMMEILWLWLKNAPVFLVAVLILTFIFAEAFNRLVGFFHRIRER